MARVRFRVDFSPGCSVGPGKIDLLEAIIATGSLSEAARSLGMSYRRAWLLLDSLNHSFNTPLTRATVGGRGGGGVTLTEFALKLVKRYRKFEGELRDAAERSFREIADEARSGPAKDEGRPRRAPVSRKARPGRAAKRP